eukprot:3025626-Pyramimonas_sp.AAC.1
MLAISFSSAHRLARERMHVLRCRCGIEVEVPDGSEDAVFMTLMGSSGGSVPPVNHAVKLFATQITSAVIHPG